MFMPDRQSECEVTAVRLDTDPLHAALCRCVGVRRKTMAHVVLLLGVIISLRAYAVQNRLSGVNEWAGTPHVYGTCVLVERKNWQRQRELSQQKA
jgi:hypothetical protein